MRNVQPRPEHADDPVAFCAYRRVGRQQGADALAGRCRTQPAQMEAHLRLKELRRFVKAILVNNSAFCDVVIHFINFYVV